MSDLHEMLGDGTLTRIVRSFREATGLVAAVVDISGMPVLSPSTWENCAVCRLVRTSREGLERCRLSYADAGVHAARLGGLHVFRCHAGLLNWATPLMADGRHIGTVVCGQVAVGDQLDVFARQVAERAQGLGIERTALLAAASDIELLSVARVQAAAELLSAVATYVTRSSNLVLKLESKGAPQRVHLDDEAAQGVHATRPVSAQVRAQVNASRASRVPSASGTSAGIYSREREQELLGAVRSGDRVKARGVLNDMVADVLLGEQARLDILKARLLELAVFLSRAAVEAGAELEQILGLNCRRVEELSRLDTLEDLCFWIVRILDQFMDSIPRTADGRPRAIVREAVRYIRNGIGKRLSVDEVAAAVHVSPSHLSHIFRQDLGMTVMECTTRIRLEEAKRLLGDVRHSISEVARMVGYRDPAHFSRCFKKSEGVSPTAFRHRATC